MCIRDSLTIVQKHALRLDAIAAEGINLDHQLVDVFGFQTLKRSYLLKHNDVCEMPAYLYMRCALVTAMAWGDNKCLVLRKANRDRGMEKPYITEEEEQTIEEEVLCAAESFARRLFQREATFATPVMFNAACKKNANLASCFLVAMTKDLDSIDGIFSTLHRCALISAMSGGLGVSMHDIRAKGAPIKNNHGTSQGLLPVMRQFNEMAKSVDQGGGKRRGSCAVYLEMHHPDLMTFLEARHTHGQMERRTHDLFFCLLYTSDSADE